MNELIKQYLYIFYSAILFLFIANTFIENEILTYIIGLLAIPMLVISFFSASKLFRILGIVFVIAGAALFIYSGLPFNEIPLLMTSTMPLLAFLTVLPWMNSVIRAGRYDRRINELMKANVSDLGKLYVRSNFTTYILTNFISLTALLVSQEVLLENMSKIKKKITDSFINETTLRAFALAITWSPMEIMVAMTVDATGVSYLAYLPWLFLISFVFLTFDSWRGNLKFRSISYVKVEEQPTRTINTKDVTLKIVKLFLALTIFLITVVLIGSYFHLNFILSVTLVILPYAFGWALLMKRRYSFLAIGWETWKIRTNNMQNFVVLFLSLAFFSNSLNATPFLQLIQQPFLASSESPLIVLFLIQLTYLVMSMVGVHPIATIGVLVEALQPLFTVMNPLSIGIVLITGALATSMAGTYNVSVMMTSINTNQNPYRIMVQNLPFALFYGVVGTLVGYFLL
ncbi:hypothetical protein GN156_16035 [bacterium LRH843]|nr:hypothetical protein [bacterium LRH843]